MAATYPCSDDPGEIIEAVAGSQTNAEKFDKFINGLATEEVQLGGGQPTPTLRNVVHLVKSAASTLDNADVSGKFSDAANGGTELRTLADRFGDAVNVKDFGAEAQGRVAYLDSSMTSNTEAVQDAIDAAAESGLSVWIPAGVMYYRSEIDDKGVHIIDDSIGYRITSDDPWWHPVIDGDIVRVAHRGLSAVYPENTVLSFSAAGELGFDGIETDICWTSDGYPVCIHDVTLDRTTTGTGNVSSKTLAQVRALDAGSWVDASYSTCKVPTFEEYLEECSTYGCAPFIELKSDAGATDARIQALVDKVVEYNLQRKAVFLAFNWSYLGTVRFYNSEVGVCGLQSVAYNADNLLYLDWLGGRVYWGPDYHIVTKALVSPLSTAGKGVYTWTVGGSGLQAVKKAGCFSAGMNTWLF